MEIKFGPAGNSDSFYEQGHKESIEMPEWLHNLGLNAYEYSCSKGVRIKEETAKKLGENARNFGITLSIHAPYYINLATEEEKNRKNSKRFVFETLRVAKWMGAQRIVFHPGSCKGQERSKAFLNVKKLLEEILDETKGEYEDIYLCPETMGKKNQVGSLEEVVELCKLSERLIPNLDFGHIHAFNIGGLNSKEDFLKVIEYVENNLGIERVKNFHCHFSRIEYTSSGEKRHLTLKDIQYGPEFLPLAEILIEKDLKPIIICESRGTMVEDALELKRIYESLRYKGG